MQDPVKMALDEYRWGWLIRLIAYASMAGFALVTCNIYLDIHTAAFLFLAGFMFGCLLLGAIDSEPESVEINSARFIRAGKFFIKAAFFSALITLFISTTSTT